MNPSTMPQIAIPRSKWLQEFNHSSSMLHGDLVPLDCFEVLPGDDYSVKKGALEVIMSTPIAPIFGNIKAKITAFYIPMRLLWNHTEEFFGANKTSSGPQLGTYTIPSRNIFSDSGAIYSVSHYLGKPVEAYSASKTCNVSVLKERGYWFLWSEWYRAQQLQAPFIMSNGDSGTIGSVGGLNKTFGSLCAKVCKQTDPFTCATLSPQYGAAVELPLGSYAPVVTAGSTLHDMGGSIRLNNGTGYDVGKALGIINSTDEVKAITGGSSPSFEADFLDHSNLVVDLAHATAAKINDIRYAFQLQKYLERSNYGSRFFEVLAVHYGVTSPDSRLQRPEYLGGKTSPIIIRTVMSQAGYNAGVTQEVGQLGVASITSIDISGLFSKGFVEPGYVYIMLSTNHERSYSQGVLREDTKKDRFEFYSPEFANLGDQEIKNKEIMVTGDSTDEETFGYQGHWDEYRFRQNRVSGLLDPNVTGALTFWTLAENFASRPSLSASFIEENRDCLSRCLVSGLNGPDYIFDFYVQYGCTREMPMRAIPGLVDHFGAL